MSRTCQAVKTTSNITKDEQKGCEESKGVQELRHGLRILKKKIKNQICTLQSVLIFSILNHPCPSMVYYYLFDVFLS